MAAFDFKELTTDLFDYVGPGFPDFRAQGKDRFALPDLMGIGSDSLKGRPFFMTVVLEHEGVPIPLPNEPLVAITSTKTIVETPTVGKYRKGTVKEYITTEDYQITFRGVCFNDLDVDRYPAEQVFLLRKLFEINDSLGVVGSPFFELFGIRNIVLKEMTFDEMAGQQGLQKYTITAVSDQDFYADLDEREKTLP